MQVDYKLWTIKIDIWRTPTFIKSISKLIETLLSRPSPSPALIFHFTTCVWMFSKPHGRRPRWRVATCKANATHSLAQLVSKTKLIASTLASYSTSPKGIWVWLPLKSRARSRTTLSLPMACNKCHQFPTCPSGHNPLLMSNSRFQVSFVTNSNSISLGSETGPGHANRGWDSSLPKLAHLCLLWEPNPTYDSSFGLAIRPLTTGRGFTMNEPEWETPPSIHMLLQPSAGNPPLLDQGSLRDNPGNSWFLVLGLSKVVFP